MPTIAAIETVFDGYRFRSRLEARHAVFFKELGIDYRYEAEAFDLDGVGACLPDFWLPERDVYIEIKPTRSEAEALKFQQRCEALMWQTGSEVHCFWGEVGLIDGIRSGALAWDCGNSGGGRGEDNCQWVECLSCGDFGMSYPPGQHVRCINKQGGGVTECTERIRNAYLSARHSRFDGWWLK